MIIALSGTGGNESGEGSDSNSDEQPDVDGNDPQSNLYFYIFFKFKDLQEGYNIRFLVCLLLNQQYL